MLTNPSYLSAEHSALFTKHYCPTHKQYPLTLIDLDALPETSILICSKCDKSDRRGHQTLSVKEYNNRKDEYDDKRSEKMAIVRRCKERLKETKGQQLQAIKDLCTELRSGIKALERQTTESYSELERYLDHEAEFFYRQRLDAPEASLEDLEKQIEREIESWKFLDRIDTEVPAKISELQRHCEGLVQELSDLRRHYVDKISEVIGVIREDSKLDLRLTEMADIIRQERKRKIKVALQWSETLKHKDIQVAGARAQRRKTDILYCRTPTIVSALGETSFDPHRKCTYSWTFKLVKVKEHLGIGMSLERSCVSQSFISHSMELKRMGHGHYIIYVGSGFVSSDCDSTINDKARAPIFPSSGLIHVEYDTENEKIRFRSDTNVTFEMRVKRPIEPDAVFRPEIRMYDMGDTVELANTT